MVTYNLMMLRRFSERTRFRDTSIKDRPRDVSQGVDQVSSMSTDDMCRRRVTSVEKEGDGDLSRKAWV